MTHKYGIYAAVVAAILGVQALIPYLAGHAGAPSGAVVLKEMPYELNDWKVTEEIRFSDDVLGALAPDDYLARLYQRGRDRKGGELLVAYFRDQANGFGPHSPQVCLPASGWDPVVQNTVTVADGKGGSFRANHFVIQQGERKSVVLYWYHSAARVTVGEIEARLWLAWDSMLLKGTDIALVRLVVPVTGNDTQAATAAAEEMATSVHQNLRRVWRTS